MDTKRFWIPVVLVIGGLFVAAGFALLFGLIVMALWNWLMPAIFGITTITYWQAWGLVLLAHILFKSNSGHGSGRRHKSKRKSGDWEQRFEDRMRRRFHPDDRNTYGHPNEDGDDEDGDRNEGPDEAPIA